MSAAGHRAERQPVVSSARCTSAAICFAPAASGWMPAAFPLNITLVTIAALASYYLVERPALELRQRWEKKLFLPSKPLLVAG